MAMLLFRDAQITDLPTIVGIYNSTIAGRMVTADTEPVSVEDRMDWFLAHKVNYRPLWVVEEETHQMIGWISFQSFYGRPAYCHTVEVSIYLSESYRGKGLGRMILKESLHRALPLGMKNFMGFIFSHNLPSVKLFESLGFKQWGLLPAIAEIDGVPMDLKILGLQYGGI